MQRNKDEVIIGKGLSGIAPLMKRLSPGLVAWVNRRAFRRVFMPKNTKALAKLPGN